jgi:hypothetical protein
MTAQRKSGFEQRHERLYRGSERLASAKKPLNPNYILDMTSGASSGQRGGLPVSSGQAAALAHAAAIVLWGAEVESCVPVWVSCGSGDRTDGCTLGD